eukprot:2319384-Amphidinium_carterae.1
MEELGPGYTIVRESPPVAESQSNGTIERAVQTVGGMVRTHKLALEEAIGSSIAANHPIIPWLIRHAGVMTTLFERGAD